MTRVPSTARGIGLLSGLSTALVAGALDAALMLHVTPPGAIAPSLVPLVVFDCVAVLLSVGLGLAVALEALLWLGRRSPPLVSLAEFLTDGPSRWFRADPSASAPLALVAAGLSATLAGFHAATLWIATHFHSNSLAALAITLCLVGLLGASLTLASLAARPLAWALARIGAAGSPGAVALAWSALVTVGLTRYYNAHETWLRALEWSAIKVFAAMACAAASGLWAMGAWRRRVGRPLDGRVCVGAVGLSLAASVLVAVTFGARQTVASNVALRSAVTGYCLRALTALTDRDRDGYSALYNGGDCDDGDPRINPAARDVPGNGVDENCSGHDARPVHEESNGHFVALDVDGARPSFVFLSIDAMRGDHMGAYGYARPTTPHLDAFAARSARFTHAYCTSPRSLRSFASVFTGLYPSAVRWGTDNQYPPLSLDNVTLAERLHDAGWATGAFCNGDYFARTPGFYQGFGTVREGERFKSEASETVSAAVQWITGRAAEPAPFFAWIHLLEPHEPYRDLTSPRDFGHAPVDQYDEELARADEAAAPLLAALDELSRARPVVVVIFGDHGEGFGEHGYFHHSYDLHEEAVRVPLIVGGVGVAPGTRAALASLMDLSPTVLNLAGLSPPEGIHGWSLVRPLREPTVPWVGDGWRTRLYAEVTPDGMLPFEQKALIEPPFKLLWDVRRGLWELFDLTRDPSETINLFDASPALAARTRGELTSWVEGLTDRNDRTQDLIAAARLPRMPAMKNPVHMRFGDVVELLGYEIDTRAVPVLGTMHVTLFLRPLSVTREPVWLTLFFDSYDGSEVWHDLRASHHAVQGRYPSTRWVPGEILRDEVTLRVEREVRPARLHMRFKVERLGRLRNEPAQGECLPDGSIELGDVEILPPRE